MKKLPKLTLPRLCSLAGTCLLIVAAGMLAWWLWSGYIAQRQAARYVHIISNQIPTPQSAAPEERRDNTMPILSIEGTGFAAILEMPKFDSALPVCDTWGDVSQYPCRFSGSAYDRTIQIGATTQAGQYDFYREISVGDTVLLTDMEGNRFCYSVTDIRYEKHADPAALQQKDAALTLFIKNVYAMEYILILCNT